MSTAITTTTLSAKQTSGRHATSVKSREGVAVLGRRVVGGKHQLHVRRAARSTIDELRYFCVQKDVPLPVVEVYGNAHIELPKVVSLHTVTVRVESWNTYRYAAYRAVGGEQIQGPHERIVGDEQVGALRARCVDGDEGLLGGQLRPRYHLLPGDVDTDGGAVLHIHADVYEHMALPETLVQARLLIKHRHEERLTTTVESSGSTAR